MKNKYDSVAIKDESQSRLHEGTSYEVCNKSENKGINIRDQKLQNLQNLY